MLKFNLSVLKAYSGSLITEEQWKNWASQSPLPLPSEVIFKPTSIPMMQARRMGLADKMAIQLALELNATYPDIDAIVFASRHGQLVRTYKLLERFFRSGEMSPTDFATAVHNAPAGQFSILAKQTAPISSIAAEERTFSAGLLEALLALYNGKKRVLYVMFDGEIPEFYQPTLNSTDKSEPYALAMVLEPGDNWKIELQKIEKVQTKYYPEGLQFLRYFYQEQSNFYLNIGEQQWHFSHT